MIIGQRILARLPQVKLSQSELARRVGISQGAMNNLIAGRSRSSTHLHKIARHLATTPAYLTGEVDDPDENAPPPAAALLVQFVSLPVALPSEPALAAAFLGLLLGSEGMEPDELARELAARLPIVLRQAAAALPPSPTDDPQRLREAEEALATGQPAGQRARHT